MDLTRLHAMIDQIALNFAAIGNDNAVAATADHIIKFWDPRMKTALLAGELGALSPIARGAVAMLAKGVEHIDVVARWRAERNGQACAHFLREDQVPQLLGFENVIFIASPNHLEAGFLADLRAIGLSLSVR